MGVRCHVADFIQQQCTAVCLLEFTDTPLISSGERTSFMSEEFAFQEGLGNGCTIDGEKRSLASSTMLVQGSCDELLTGAALTDDEHIDILRGNAANLLADRLHRHAAADESIRSVFRPISFIEQRRHMRHPADHQSLFDHSLQLLGVERLGEIVIGPQFHRLNGGLGRAESCDEDHQALGIQAVQFVEQFESGRSSQPDVEEHHIRTLLRCDPQRFVRCFRLEDNQVLTLENGPNTEADAGLVIDNQQLGHRQAPGNSVAWFRQDRCWWSTNSGAAGSGWRCLALLSGNSTVKTAPAV